MDHVFYDGECGLCHRAVVFALRRDPDGSRFRFAPLGGETFTRLLDPAVRRALPDSLVVLSETGAVHSRSRAVFQMMRRIGGGWGALAAVLDLVPHSVADLGYVGVASIRRRLFRAPVDACPVPPGPVRDRFDP